MSRVVETTVYKFEELSDSAKEKAREWYRQGNCQDEWWDSVYEDAATVAEKLGIDLRTKSVKLMGGGTRQDPCIYFSGFSSQGDGACFEGHYRYKKGSVKEVSQYAPQDKELHRIARELQDLQRRYFYSITATVTHRDRYCHERSVDIDVDFGERSHNVDDAESVAELLRDFMQWIYESLETEWDGLNSDGTVEENIIANEYEFEEDGSRA